MLIDGKKNRNAMFMGLLNGQPKIRELPEMALAGRPAVNRNQRVLFIPLLFQYAAIEFGRPCLSKCCSAGCLSSSTG